MRFVVLVAARPFKHLGDMIVLGCFMQSFERAETQIGVSLAVSEFQMTRRVPVSDCAYGTDQSQGLALS